MTTKERLLLESKAWRLEKVSQTPNFFERLEAQRSPKILWIHSSDSLISVQELTNTEPGDIIVYANIANQVSHEDYSLLSILEDAVEVKQVTHIVICGYSHCTGIKSVLTRMDQRSATREWLSRLHKLYEEHREAFQGLEFNAAEKLLSELNIRQQVLNVSALPVMQKAWLKSKYPKIFGWYFDLPTGHLKEVFSMESHDALNQTATLVESR